MKKKRMKINKKIVYSGIISLIIIINFFNFFLIIKNSKNSPDYLTGNAIYNSPLTIEQLKNGIKLNKGTNNFYWTKELEQNLVIDEALSSILNNINYIYNYNERKWWFNPSGNFARYLTNPLYKDKLFSEMKPGYKYFLNMKNEDVLNFEIASCKDSDNGIDYTNQGVVTRGSESFTDGCLNSKTVIENYCNNNEIENLDYNCNVGELCKDGKCVASKLADSNKINSCERIFDIIPSGSSLSIKDVNINVLTTNEDNFQFSAEIKVNDNNYNLNYLNNYVEININNIRYTVILITVLDSSAVIYVGICETVKMCSDSDNGKNYYIKGTLSTASEKKEDVCLDNKLLSEYVYLFVQ